MSDIATDNTELQQFIVDGRLRVFNSDNNILGSEKMTAEQRTELLEQMLARLLENAKTGNTPEVFTTLHSVIWDLCSPGHESDLRSLEEHKAHLEMVENANACLQQPGYETLAANAISGLKDQMIESVKDKENKASRSVLVIEEDPRVTAMKARIRSALETEAKIADLGQDFADNLSALDLIVNSATEENEITDIVPILILDYQKALASGIPLYQLEIKKIVGQCKQKFGNSKVLQEAFAPLDQYIQIADQAETYTLE